MRKQVLNNKYGRLVVIEDAGGRNVLCRCDCDNELMVDRYSLIRGNTKSCGCLHKETSSINGKNNRGNHVNVAENNGMWKDETVGYGGIHAWIRSRKPKPQYCECCGIKPPIDLANISGEYKRDINDFEWLCRSCHMTKDGRLERLNNINKMIDGSKFVWECIRCSRKMIASNKPTKCLCCNDISEFVLVDNLIITK